MKELVCNKPGELEYQQSVKPVAQPGEAILRVKRIGICGTDLHAYEGTQPFFNYPRILGHELALEVEEAEGFEKEEAVTIIPYFHCGKCIACRTGKTNCCATIRVLGVHIDGGMREYITVPPDCVLHGCGLSFDELALVEPLAVGAHAVRRAGIQPGEFVLIIGAGPIGLGIMEFARIAGAHVIVLDINEQRLSFCKQQLKVQYVVNGISADVSEQLKQITNGDMPTVLIDATGSLKAVNNAFQYMAHGARFVLVGLQKENISFNHPEFHKREATLMSSRNATREDFEQVIDCMKRKLVDPSVYITHRVAFEEVKNNFKKWLDPSNGVIKAIVEMN